MVGCMPVFGRGGGEGRGGEGRGSVKEENGRRGVAVTYNVVFHFAPECLDGLLHLRFGLRGHPCQHADRPAPCLPLVPGPCLPPVPPWYRQVSRPCYRLVPRPYLRRGLRQRQARRACKGFGKHVSFQGSRSGGRHHAAVGANVECARPLHRSRAVAGRQHLYQRALAVSGGTVVCPAVLCRVTPCPS